MDPTASPSLCVAERIHNPLFTWKVIWDDDTPAMLRTPAAAASFEHSRALAQMRRRSWPSIQERCLVCNDLFPIPYYQCVGWRVYVQYACQPCWLNRISSCELCWGRVCRVHQLGQHHEVEHLRKFPPLDKPDPYFLDPRHSEDDRFLVERDLRALLFQAESGCHTCSLIAQAIYTMTTAKEKMSWIEFLHHFKQPVKLFLLQIPFRLLKLGFSLQPDSPPDWFDIYVTSGMSTLSPILNILTNKIKR
jgi:hypothetical protein